MYRGDTWRHEAQPQDGPEKEAQVEVKEICAQGEMKNLRATIQEKEEAILDLTEKLNFEIKLRSESEATAKVLHSERDDLKSRVESLAINLEDQDELGHDNVKAWRLRFSALEKSTKEEKTSESNFLATIQEKEEAILDLTEKLSLETKLRSESEATAKVLSSKIDDLENKIDSLCEELDSEVDLHKTMNKYSNLRYLALRQRYKGEKESASNLMTTIEENEEAILDLTEKLELEIKLRSESESNAEVLYSDMDDLKNKVESLSKDLHAQVKLGRDSDKAWQLRFSALEEESNNKEKASESSLKALLTERRHMENKIQSLSEDLKAQTKLVSDSDKAWKDKMSTLKRESALKEKTLLTAAHMEREALLQKSKEQSCEMHSWQNNHEEEIRRLRRQIVNLEDICLGQKKKNLRCEPVCSCV